MALLLPALLLSVLRWLYVVESMSLSPELPVVRMPPGPPQAAPPPASPPMPHPGCSPQEAPQFRCVRFWWSIDK